MTVTVLPGALRGSLRAIASKSDAHRQLILAALSDAPTRLVLRGTSEDIRATARCLGALGAGIEPLEDGFTITPLWGHTPESCELDCHESGSTLRFLMPVAAALGVRAKFIARGRLAERPNEALMRALRKNGAQFDGDAPPLTVAGRLRPGRYDLPGDVSSQYASGLMMALPLLPGESEIAFSTPLQSRGYAEMTADALARYGAAVQTQGMRWRVPSARYVSPGSLAVEGDWSNAAFFLAARALGSDVNMEGLDVRSRQPDRAILALLDRMGGDIDVSGCPDLLPILAVVAALHEGQTRLTNAARLRLKESDRLAAMRECLGALGAEVEERQDMLVIRGGRLTSGTVDAHNDHRIAMAMAIAGTAAQGPVTILGAEAVNKSYPDFFSDFQALGGRIE